MVGDHLLCFFEGDPFALLTLINGFLSYLRGNSGRGEQIESFAGNRDPFQILQPARLETFKGFRYPHVACGGWLTPAKLALQPRQPLAMRHLSLRGDQLTPNIDD